MPRSYLNPFMIHEDGLWGLFTVNGTYRLMLRSGRYRVKLCGGGGAGGENGTVGWPSNVSGGVGGAGGTAEVFTLNFNFTTPTPVTLYVGKKGLTKAHGGNGGAGGSGGSGSELAIGGKGGAGGGGGEPSWFRNDSTNMIYFIEGAGGGGGGGGGGVSGVVTASRGGGGGGGGGWYTMNGTIIESVDGKAGGNQTASSGQNGTAGNTTWFPNLSSGRGGNGTSGGYGISGGAAASGGGASGGSGGGWGAYVEDGSVAGGGGGGAGGSGTAGGGTHGLGGYGTLATDGSNPHTTPTAGVDYQGYTVTSGWGVGGTTNTDGSDGWIYIERLGNPT